MGASLLAGAGYCTRSKLMSLADDGDRCRSCQEACNHAPMCWLTPEHTAGFCKLTHEPGARPFFCCRRGMGGHAGGGAKPTRLGGAHLAGRSSSRTWNTCPRSTEMTAITLRTTAGQHPTGRGSHHSSFYARGREWCGGGGAQGETPADGDACNCTAPRVSKGNGEGREQASP